MHVCVRELDPLELEVTNTCEPPIWVLGTEPGSFGRAANALNNVPSLQAPISKFFKSWKLKHHRAKAEFTSQSEATATKSREQNQTGQLTPAEGSRRAME